MGGNINNRIMIISLLALVLIAVFIFFTRSSKVESPPLPASSSGPTKEIAALSPGSNYATSVKAKPTANPTPTDEQIKELIDGENRKRKTAEDMRAENIKRRADIIKAESKKVLTNVKQGRPASTLQKKAK